MTHGILLTNTGTPDQPTTQAVRAYLREFLSDKRVVQLPRIIWLPILFSLVLSIRPQRIAKLYQKIWQQDGAPMRHIMHKIARSLEQKLDCPVAVGMHYGNPSIKTAIDSLKSKQIKKIIALPLFPQYSHTTTAASYDRIAAALKSHQPFLKAAYHHSYATHSGYIDALVKSVKNFWHVHGKGEHFIISFHGMPKRYIKKGDPYEKDCQHTASLLAKSLNLSTNSWSLAYQSKFGYDKWLSPSLQSLLKTLPLKKIKTVDVICPGFAVDCLETLEEIAIRGHAIFQDAGGKKLRYIPALNDSDQHIDLLMRLAKQMLT